MKLIRELLAEEISEKKYFAKIKEMNNKLKSVAHAEFRKIKSAQIKGAQETAGDEELFISQYKDTSTWQEFSFYNKKFIFHISIHANVDVSPKHLYFEISKSVDKKPLFSRGAVWRNTKIADGKLDLDVRESEQKSLDRFYSDVENHLKQIFKTYKSDFEVYKSGYSMEHNK